MFVLLFTFYQNRVFLELIFVSAVKNGSCLFFSHADSYLSQHILLRSLSFPRCSTVTICTSSDCVGDLFLDLSSLLIYVPVPAPIPYLFHHCSSIISLDVLISSSPNSTPFFKCVLDVLGTFRRTLSGF